MATICNGCLIAQRGQQTAHCNAGRARTCKSMACSPGTRLHQILYLGEVGLSGATLDEAIDDIRSGTAERARMFGLSGALMLTKSGFAQLLEGRRAEVEMCLAALRSDPRHADALLIEEGPVGARQFGGWSVSYADPASFVGRMMFQAIAAAALGARRDINRLVRVMLESSAGSDSDLEAARPAAGHQVRTAV